MNQIFDIYNFSVENNYTQYLTSSRQVMPFYRVVYRN